MLVTLLGSDVDENVRQSAALALERRRDPNYAPFLEASATGDPSPLVRAAARKAYEGLWPFSKRPRIAAGLSILCPGCGHLYLRQYGEGAAYLGATAALVASGLVILTDNEVPPELGDPERLDTIDPEDPLAVPLLMAGQNLWFYSIFDAYRDARVLRGDPRITRETLPALASAPFRPSVLKSPWVWAIVPVAIGLGAGLTYLVAPEDFSEGRRSIREVDRVNFLGRQYSRGAGVALGEVYYGSLFVPVGVGEEALFRGFVQTELSDAYGPWWGWAGASLIFGAVHIFNFLQPGAREEDALYAVPYITLVGSTLGLAYMGTGYRLETSVAMHFWYDFGLSTVGFLADPEHQPFIARVALPF
jgi:membrane protease YdiL (CAAX protease family)